jgi:DNA repair protein RecN (Recombination protein N)
LLVAKQSDSDTTRTQIEVLDAAGRRNEISRMLGGVEITRETRAHAKQMLDRAQG